MAAIQQESNESHLMERIDEAILHSGDQFIKRDGAAVDCTLCEKEIK